MPTMGEQDYRGFWIYHSRVGRYAAIHRADCGFCNHGRGVGGGYNQYHASWVGPFRSLDDAARQVFTRTRVVQQLRYCQRCV